jgi:hypothetical protein
MKFYLLSGSQMFLTLPLLEGFTAYFCSDFINLHYVDAHIVVSQLLPPDQMPWQ